MAAANEKLYTEDDLREAFMCGVRQAIDQGDPEPEYSNWIECLWLNGFSNETLFNRPGFELGMAAKLTKDVRSALRGAGNRKETGNVALPGKKSAKTGSK